MLKKSEVRSQRSEVCGGLMVIGYQLIVNEPILLRLLSSFGGGARRAEEEKEAFDLGGG